MVQQAALAVVDTTMTENTELRVSRFSELQNVLAKLRKRYGEHPILLETEANFTDGAAAQMVIYKKAKTVAMKHGFPLLSICLSMAHLYLEELDDVHAARDELVACRNEVADVMTHDRLDWCRLMTECNRLTLRSQET